MKKIVAAVAAVLVSATLVTAVPASAAPTGRNDNLYVSLVRSEAPELYGLSKRQLISLAKSICKTLRTTSYGMLDVAEMGVESGFSEDAAIALVAGAVTFYCPDQENNY